MKRFLQLVILVMLSIYNAIQTVTGGASLKKLVPTGVINQGILGGFTGKVGPVVGGKWKDIDYMRGYVVPANPNTTGQQTVRAKFSALVALARQLLPGLLQPFWDKYYSSMSGFNAWISQNYSLATAAGVVDETAIISKGTLTGVVNLACTYDTSNGTVAATWDDNSGSGDALGTDFALMVALDMTGQIFSIEGPVGTRGSESGAGSIATGLTASEVSVFIFFSQGIGNDMVVCDSSGVVCTAA